MRFYLFIKMGNNWRFHSQSFSYEDLLKVAMELPESNEWMICQEKRYCSGTEIQTI